jgi:hypothetical protein
MKVAVGALPVFRGVKCCCKVEKAGRWVFEGSSGPISRRFAWVERDGSGLAAVAMPVLPLGASGLALILAERFSPAIRIDDLAPLCVLSAETLLGLEV